MRHPCRCLGKNAGAFTGLRSLLVHHGAGWGPLEDALESAAVPLGFPVCTHHASTPESVRKRSSDLARAGRYLILRAPGGPLPREARIAGEPLLLDEMPTYRSIAASITPEEARELLASAWEFWHRRAEDQHETRTSEPPRTAGCIASPWGLRLKMDELLLSSSDPAMQKVWSTLEKYAASDVPVLLLGETGVGKTTAARFIHDKSPRRSGRYVEQNCAGIPDALFLAELNGYGKGAFTGALEANPGRILMADHGTIVLEDVVDLSPLAQVSLLQFVETGVVVPLGNAPPWIADVRIIATSHRDMTGALEEGDFREDLFYRLHRLVVEIPRLRARPTDLERLLDLFLADANKKMNRNVEVSSAIRSTLLAYEWPGNIRQLQNYVERAVILEEFGPPSRW